MAEIGTQNFPRTKRFDMEERKTLVFNAKQRTIGVSGQSGIVSHREKHGFRCRGTFHERQAAPHVVTPERGSGWRSPGPRGGLSQMNDVLNAAAASPGFEVVRRRRSCAVRGGGGSAIFQRRRGGTLEPLLGAKG